MPSGSFMHWQKKKPIFFSPVDVIQVINNQEFTNHRELINKISLKRSFYDDMFQNDAVQYLKVGLSGIQCIETAIQESNVSNIKQILDLPCGYGRVLRFITKFFPHAEITACDINKSAVEFCRKEFGTLPLNSMNSFKKFHLKKKFDLIWCGSLATHIDSENTKDLLGFFYRHLNFGGLLVISMHGRHTLEYLRLRNNPYLLDDKRIEKILFEVQYKGYGYADYKGFKGYGISVATPEWMKAAFEISGKWRNYRISEKAWDHNHDIYSVVKE